MILDDTAEAMRAGAFGEARRRAIEHQIAVGSFFDAVDFVPVAQAHVMGDTESLGEAGIAHLEWLAAQPEAERRTRIPTITDPRGLDFAAYRRLGQTETMAALERRASEALEALGVLMTNTCINYQTVMPPTRGEHLAMGDTGVAIYCNSVLGARTNFEGGPSALAAGLTGLTPRYGYHLDRYRRATRRFVVEASLRDLADWGALGALIGRSCNSYWEVPVIEGIHQSPGSDGLKQLGAAMASFGSTALFHLVGLTAEAGTVTDVADGTLPEPTLICDADLDGLFRRYGAPGEKVDVVVFSAPQLSLIELDDLARRLDGRRVHPETTLLAATSPENKRAADRMGLTGRIEAAGGLVLEGVCFYQSYAREMAQALGWQRLMTPSAKLVNIIGGYGYEPTLGTVEQCIEAAVAGRIGA
ncbi:aconitase X catalytic domain-containing protein [Methylobacterium durans]|uniref:aconitase X catalytic domain-containing protein n=1 Tax=Methylobacterium durans TaxID=2202825 RepID=UPI002AFDCAA9|nr:aconitase X catalytic domain-containing protein [Methylobacterium durans]MEA1834952.1 aconitase X catalytic domain-containing protein [Methylobacterium durans]